MPVVPDFTRGLSHEQARERLVRDGPNELPATGRRSAWGLLRDVVREPMFLLLVACGAIYLALGDRHEALMLLGFVAVVIAITYVQKRRSERSLEALRDLSSPRALVMRDGQAVRIAGRELVVDDVVLLAEGDRVPADLRLLDASSLTVDESLLTGESVPVMKHAVTGPEGEAEETGARVFSGTLVTQGSGRGIVVATGARSALGRIGESLQAITSGPTPVQQETQRIVTWVAVLGLGLAASLAVAWGLSRGDWLHGLLAGITLAMAILPEELPVVLTIFLGLGAWRLAREKVLTRSMPAVELLGATTVLCVDKTGTLTMNRMALRRLWVDGASHQLGAEPAQPLPEAFHGIARVRRAGQPPARVRSHGGGHRAGRPVATGRHRAPARRLATGGGLPAVARVARDVPRLAVARPSTPAGGGQGGAGSHRRSVSPRRRSPRHHRARRSRPWPATDCASWRWRARCSGRASLPEIQHDFDFEFVGLIALEDPVRPDVPAAIAECRAAGIRVVMITGDHPQTAMSIARQAGLVVDGRFLSGPEIDGLDDAALASRLADTDVFCRVQPQQKLRLVQAFRARGEVVAMTGDGVNDAPALKAAHIGVAMGARGTDVAREAAALVLLNDDFASLVTAVRYGRRVFANLRKAITFVLAVHLPIVGLSVLPVLLGWPMVLMPVHILFLQLVIDPACSIVFEAEPLEAGAMRVPPRNPLARLFDRQVLWRGLVQGSGLLVIVLVAYVYARSVSGSDESARALAFSVLVLSNLALIQANRRWARQAGEGLRWNAAFGWIAVITCGLLVAILAIPAVGGLFAFAAPTPNLLAVGAGLCLLAFGWFEAVKWLDAHTTRPHA